MATFKDNDNREWEIRLDGPLIMRIREDCDPDFLKNDFSSGDNNTYARLLDDPVLLGRVVYLICDKERRNQGISEDDFNRSVIGEAIDRATDALLDAMKSFSPGRTKQLLEAFAKQEQLQRKAIAKTVERMNQPEFEAELMHRFDSEVESPSMPPKSVIDTPDLSE